MVTRRSRCGEPNRESLVRDRDGSVDPRLHEVAQAGGITGSLHDVLEALRETALGGSFVTGSAGTIYTFGYGGRQVQTLAALVALHEAILIDVRLKPWTKQPGWSLGELKMVFTDRYHWVQALGNTNFEKGGKVRLKDEKKGIGLLVQMVRAGESPILLCGERDPSGCHRSVIANLVAKLTGATVVHLPISLGIPAEPLRSEERRVGKECRS